MPTLNKEKRLCDVCITFKYNVDGLIHGHQIQNVISACHVIALMHYCDGMITHHTSPQVRAEENRTHIVIGGRYTPEEVAYAPHVE